MTTLRVESAALVGAVAARDVVDPDTGEVLVECNEEISPDALQRLYQSAVTAIEVLLIESVSRRRCSE